MMVGQQVPEWLAASNLFQGSEERNDTVGPSGAWLFPTEVEADVSVFDPAAQKQLKSLRRKPTHNSGVPKEVRLGRN